MTNDELTERARAWVEAFRWNNFDETEPVDEGLISDLTSFAAIEREAACREFAEKTKAELNDLVGLLMWQAADNAFRSMFGKELE
jgi:hypothetical protein